MSSEMNTSDQYRELIEAYALGALDAEERAEVEAHLASGCTECATALEEARWAVSQLAYLAPEAAPSDMLRERLVQTVRAEARALTRPAKSAIPAWLWAGMAAMLLFTVYTAWDAHQVGVQVRSANERVERIIAENRKLSAEIEIAKREAIEADPQSVRIVSAEKTAPAMVALWHARLGILVTGQNVSEPSGNKTYQLWLIPKEPGGKPIPSLTVRPDADGKVRLLVPNPPELMANTKKLAITIEPEGGSQAPTSAPIWVGGIA